MSQIHDPSCLVRNTSGRVSPPLRSCSSCTITRHHLREGGGITIFRKRGHSLFDSLSFLEEPPRSQRRLHADLRTGTTNS